MNRFLRIVLLLLLILPLFTSAQKVGTPALENEPAEPNSYHKVSIQLAAGAGAMQVREALEDWLGWNADQSPSLRLIAEKESPGGFHYHYRGQLNNIDIFQAEIKANVTRSARILSLTHTLPEVVPSPASSHTSSPADVAAAFAGRYGNQQGFAVDVNPVWFRQEGSLLPAWHAIMSSHENWIEFVVDDHSGDYLYVHELSNYHRAEGDTNGTGLVFLPDPLTTAHVAYGSPYVDGSDADTPELLAQRKSVVLRDITLSGGVYSLTGPYVKLEDINNPIGAPATSVTGDFSYTRNAQGFEDVMCYYHIDTFQRYVQWLGFTDLYSTPLRVDPHGLSGADNSRFSYTGGEPYLEFGEGGVDDAEDADVIVHEYGHALSYSGSPLTNTGTQRQGLDEGIGDYFAASYSKTIDSYNWEWVFNWDGHNTFWPGRQVNITTLYPPGGSDIYLYGSIWASTLMQVQGEIGKFAMDKIQLQELYSNSINMTFHDAALLTLDADTLLYGGWYTPNLQKYFCLRGIFTGSECIVGTDNHVVEDLRWQVFPNPASSEVNVAVAATNLAGTFHASLSDLQGREVFSSDFTAAVTTLPLHHLEAGVYFLTLTHEGENLGVKKVVLAE